MWHYRINICRFIYAIIVTFILTSRAFGSFDSDFRLTIKKYEDCILNKVENNTTKCHFLLRHNNRDVKQFSKMKDLLLDVFFEQFNGKMVATTINKIKNKYLGAAAYYRLYNKEKNVVNTHKKYLLHKKHLATLDKVVLVSLLKNLQYMALLQKQKIYFNKDSGTRGMIEDPISLNYFVDNFFFFLEAHHNNLLPLDCDDECCICLENFEPKNELYCLPCNGFYKKHHTFHKSCVLSHHNKILEQADHSGNSKTKYICPICRKNDVLELKIQIYR